MSIRSLKRFLVGAAVAGGAVPSVALADPTCVYVIGHVNGRTVATPAVTVVVPDSDAAIQPIRVHLDETAQTILGYSVRVPGLNADSDGSPVFVPGISQHIPSISFTLPDLNLTPSRCVNVDGVSTPAVPVYVPASVLTLPGATADVGGILINLVGYPVTAPGKVITFDGKQIIVPELSAGVPSVPVGTPNQSITLDINGTVTSARYLPPNN
ncbi:MAG TPA: hypothetical protein VEZ71_17060 [Archangium sp.]|nr:hypothetical protein [Archangium sp.]